MTRIRRSFRKYPFFYSTVSFGLLGLLLTYVNRSGISDLCFIISALTALVVGTIRLRDILRHGYYGIPLLQITSIITALLLKELEVAALLAIILSTEEVAFTWYRRNQNKKISMLQIKHAPFIRFLDVVSLPFVVLVLLIGGAMWTISGEVNRFLEVVASASTAPLLLFAPIGFVNGLNKLKSLGLNIPNVSALEKLADVKSIILRKSGVLTEEKVTVSSVRTVGKHTKSDVLKVAAALASQSNHRLAQAIVAHVGSAQKVDRAKHANEVQGQGLLGRMKGLDLIIGRSSFLKAHDVSILEKQSKSGEPEVFVAQDGRLLGIIYFKEIPIEGTKNLAKKLHVAGVTNVFLASGSNTSAVAAVAKRAAITSYFGDTDADDVIRLLDECKDKPIAFIGNTQRDDAIATAADLSISVLPLEKSSSLSINNYSPLKLVTGFEIAKKTVATTQRGVFLTLFVSLLLVLVAATGRLTPVQAAGLNLGLLVAVLGINVITGLRVKSSPQ